MQFSPKNYEKIIAFARNTVQNRVICKEIDEKCKRQIRAIERVSALNRDIYLQAIDIESTVRVFLCACYVVSLKNNKILNFSISGSAFGYTDKNLLFAVLIEIINATRNEIKVKIENDTIKITAKDCKPGGYFKKLMLKHKISYFALNGNLCVCYPFKKTEYQNFRMPDIIDLLQNPLSIVNLWI